MSLERIHAVRAEIAEIKQSIIQIGNESLNEKDTVAVIDESLARLRDSVDVAHLGLLAANGQTPGPKDFLSIVNDESKVPALLAVFAGDRMREMLIASAKPFVNRKATPVAQRGENILQLQQRLLELEKLDEQLFVELEAQGYGAANGLIRRADCDMSVVMLVEDEELAVA